MVWEELVVFQQRWEWGEGASLGNVLSRQRRQDDNQCQGEVSWEEQQPGGQGGLGPLRSDLSENFGFGRSPSILLQSLINMNH